MFKKQKLKKCHLFQTLSDNELSLVAEITEEKKMKKGETLFYEGSNNQDLFVIVDGVIEISIRAIGDEKIVLTKMQDGGIIGDFAFVDEGVRSATGTVVEDAHLLLIKEKKFLELVNEYPHLGVEVYRELAKEVCLKIRDRNKKLRSSIIWESIG
jgi:CRP/FNR family transcriptional regulator, cyclic AMP receptor protein